MKIRLTLIVIGIIALNNLGFSQFKTIEAGATKKQTLIIEDLSTLAKLYHPNAVAPEQAAFQIKAALDQKVLQPSRLKVLAYNEDNLPVAISGTIVDNDRTNKDLLVKAYDYLEVASKLTKIKKPQEELTLVDRMDDELGMTRFRFNQTYNGVKIYGSEVLVHAERNAIHFVNGRWHQSLKEFNASPSKSEKETLNKIIIDKHLLINNDPFDVMGNMEPISELVIYYHEGQAYLTHHITGYPDKLHRWEYFVDAHSGQIVHEYMNSCKLHNHDAFDKITEPAAQFTESLENLLLLPLIMDGPVEMNGTDLFNRTVKLNCVDIGGTRYMIDAIRPMFNNMSALPDDPEGTIWTIDAFNSSPQKDDFNYDHVKTNASTWSNKQAAVSAHSNGAEAYKYFLGIHERNSINGGGGNIVSLVNVADEDGKTMGNAFWNGAAMFYGNGDAGFHALARGLDVAGHEMTHGVVQNTANLEYQGESGALNESFADVFGMLIDKEDWKIGEDVVKAGAFPSGALRDLSNPHNGAALNDYGAGFQPKHYNERYTGSEDNGGVHINSGIPNHAFFLFANSGGVGMDRAEQVYYRALSRYLTKSSRFTDAKIAVMKASKDLFGDAVATAAETAFNNVGIAGGSQGGGGGTPDPGDQYQTDLEINPGVNFILHSMGDQTDLHMVNTDLQKIFDPRLSGTDPISKPSVSDDGTEIVFVGADKKIHNISIDYQKGEASELILFNNNTFRNVIISKDGTRLAMLFDDLEPEVVVYDIGISDSKVFPLKNATTAAGISTGDVQYADVMEFDNTGEFIMYDAFNKIKSPTAGEITYWDINFIKVWEIDNNNFQPDDQEYYDKLFSGLPEGVDVGNPTFSKNSPYIIAFDYIDDQDNYVLGANIETGDVQILANTFDLGYPTFSKDDKFLLFDAPSVLNDSRLKFVEVKDDKISSENPDGSNLLDNAKWAVWFSNGQRILTSNEEIESSVSFELSPNPALQFINVKLDLLNNSEGVISIFDMNGKLVHVTKQAGQQGNNELKIDIESIPPGVYSIRAQFDNIDISKQFVKQ